MSAETETINWPGSSPQPAARPHGLRVGFYGGGAMAREIAAAVTTHGHAVVGAYDVRQPAAPLDAVHVESLAQLVAARPDIVVHATPRDSDLKGQLLELIAAGCPVVSISGVAHLAAEDRAAADEIHRAARQARVAVIGMGINPGFVLDLVPIFFAGACVQVTSVRARRVTDLTPYGEAVRDMYGIGLGEADFHAKVDDGRIGLHREIVQSVHMVAEALGIELESIEEAKLPILEDGRVVGFRHLCQGRPGIEMEMQGVFDPADGGETVVWIKGDPDVTVRMSAGMTDQGGRVVAARVVHVLPWLMEAAPGLRSPAELPVALGPGLVSR